MYLSKRLKAIASFVGDNTKVIDVGCDHALLDIYLLFNRKNISCVAIDSNINALKGAIQNIKKYNMEDRITLMHNDGLSYIQINKTDTIVISGLGSYTIINILTKANLDNANNIIIQSNNELYILRKSMSKLGYMIEDEKVIFEKGMYYVIIRFLKGKAKYSFMDYYLGPKIRKQNNDYVNYMTSVKQDIIKNLPKKYIFTHIKNRVMIYLLKKELSN